MPIGTTSYAFISTSPNDGFYNVSSNTNWFGWHDIEDHTSNDTNGKMLVINADFTSGEFYRTTVNGLCENTTYEFSSWMINLLPASGCNGVGIPINVKFEIWDNTDTNLLASGDTGNINGTSSPNWQQYALVFQTLPSQTSVILKMKNNGVGGCGNDLALDDIIFKSCGDAIAIEDTSNMNLISVCEDALPFSVTLTALPDFTIFSSHFYQWQESPDSVNWTDIAGETSNTYSATSINNNTFYRVKVAEDAINVNNNSCNSSSEIYEIRIISFPNAPISNGDLMICENDTTPLSVTVPSGVIVNWYDAATGGNLLLANNTSFNPTTSGLYYAEAETIEGRCQSTSRTTLQIEYLETPEVTDESFSFCENTIITLQADPTDPSIVTSYLWDNGSTNQEINVSISGTYTVIVSNNSCSVTKTITLSQIDNPIIESVISDDYNIIIKTSNAGDFLYSIDGITFQSNPIFSSVEGGQYTIYVKHQDCTEAITTQHIHFYIPKFFTPNGDNVNDTFNLKGIEFYSFSQVSIFDRYGKLLKNAVNTSFSWNGTFSGQLLPTGDYWYVIIIEGQKFTGHFTLKR
ncbi:MAG: T9SS type B sorting domain-containing protein [Algibacter sp.]|uniref:T9SS type B sorting domain-containing protein n=1 Tax=Algibacter sp. TaxID=1872428 RepID=UPI0026371ACA|nr:T9SS type B sorting domain-containing protein [Algibacter sp.]MDG1731094.1 T9SS type B sorting domain-containing protein [Algibacter sp.]MDG2177478.1 T9SS type B sorting domain-containing protein [Algibacter sp.]